MAWRRTGVGGGVRPPLCRLTPLVALALTALACAPSAAAGAAGGAPSSELGQTRTVAVGPARVLVTVRALRDPAPALRGPGAPDLLSGSGPLVALEVTLHNTARTTVALSGFTVTLSYGQTGSAEVGTDRGTSLRPWLDLSRPLAAGAVRSGWTTLQGDPGQPRSVRITLDGSAGATWSLG